MSISITPVNLGIVIITGNIAVGLIFAAGWKKIVAYQAQSQFVDAYSVCSALHSYINYICCFLSAHPV